MTKKTIVVRSGWQSINIGDIGHSPGIFALLERYAPEAHLIFWPNDENPAVNAMMRRRFPKIEIVSGVIGEDGTMNEELASAFERADLLLHGSGPSVLAWRQLRHWRRLTGKPYGIYGVTVSDVDEELKDVLDSAAFVFTRETLSLKVLRQAGVACALMGFAPDACVAVDVRDDKKASAWLQRAGLEDGQFICAVARNRKTPYHWSKPGVEWTQEYIRELEDFNYQHREDDLSKLREAITLWVRQTKMKVMLCPEMIDALSLLGPHVYAPLPDDVRPYIVLRDKWWLTDEAASIYARAFAVLSLDCHSPLIAYANGTPALYVRQPQDAQKAHMYNDFGMEQWLMPIEDVNGELIAERFLQIHDDPQGAREYLAQGNERITRIHEETLTQALTAAFGR